MDRLAGFCQGFDGALEFGQFQNWAITAIQQGVEISPTGGCRRYCELLAQFVDQAWKITDGFAVLLGTLGGGVGLFYPPRGALQGIDGFVLCGALLAASACLRANVSWRLFSGGCASPGSSRRRRSLSRIRWRMWRMVGPRHC
ncbi:hypothetical protein ACS33_15135 [Edwardsiella ictaluri]|nr:hypothetical protein ACS33_15135 [Edwardsiella ictaluri]